MFMSGSVEKCFSSANQYPHGGVTCCGGDLRGGGRQTAQGWRTGEWSNVHFMNQPEQTPEGLPSKQTLNTQPRKLGTILWMSLNYPGHSLTCHQSNISGRTWKWLQTNNPLPVNFGEQRLWYSSPKQLNVEKEKGSKMFLTAICICISLLNELKDQEFFLTLLFWSPK